MPPPTGAIRNLQLQGGDPASFLSLGNQQAQQISGVGSDLGSKVLDMLKQYQQFGQNTLNQANQEQYGRATGALPADIANVNPSPGQILSFRHGERNAVEPTIGGARDVLNQTKSVLDEYNNTQSKLQTHAENVMKTILDTTDPTSLKNLDPKFLNKTEQDAGYPKGFIQAAITYKERQQKLAEEKLAGAGGGNQNKLEQEYRQTLLKEVSSRSGGLGLEDQKVNQANHLSALAFQFYDPKTGQYNIPKSQYGELILGLARLLSPSGQTSEYTQRELTQRTAAGDIAGAITYLTGTPVTGSTQAIFQNLISSIDRQGQVAEQNRQQYIQFLHGLAPTGLDPARIERLEKTSLNPYQPTVSRGKNVNILSVPSGRITVISPTGQTGHIPQSQLQEALKNGYKQIK